MSTAKLDRAFQRQGACQNKDKLGACVSSPQSPRASSFKFTKLFFYAHSKAQLFALNVSQLSSGTPGSPRSTGRLINSLADKSTISPRCRPKRLQAEPAGQAQEEEAVEEDGEVLPPLQQQIPHQQINPCPMQHQKDHPHQPPLLK